MFGNDPSTWGTRIAIHYQHSNDAAHRIPARSFRELFEFMGKCAGKENGKSPLVEPS